MIVNTYEPFGIIAAMDGVIELLLHEVKVHKLIIQSKLVFYQGLLHNHRVILVRCGNGKVNAALCASLLARLFGVKSIIILGVSTPLDQSLTPGDIVIAQDVIQHDLDLSAGGYAPGLIPSLQLRAINTDPALSDILLASGTSLIGAALYHGRVLTGDQCITDTKSIQLLHSLFHGLAADMESAAAGLVCYLERIPFAVACAVAANPAQINMSDTPFGRLVILNLTLVIRNLVSYFMRVPS
ncbi:MAG: 5'-methylthioadenosine/S-adenosylhomocysteine nucleosidase [Peptococcaceae bacterium]|nr:5'-methylthioadenosine/S-adenosylhomocysteine nucleosidase [Peptococcaceae bacterium]